MVLEITHLSFEKDTPLNFSKLMPASRPGLVAATFTPFHDDPQRSVNLELIAPMVEKLRADGLAALYVNGSTGEGMSMTNRERMSVAETHIDAAGEDLPVIVQIGTNTIGDSRELAAHAQACGAAAISANSPSYFKPKTLEILVEWLAQVAAAAPELPFYYYHIPCRTGVEFPMNKFLPAAVAAIPTFAGVKYSALTVHEFQSCCQYDNGSLEVFFGADEMLLAGLTAGATGAVGTTFNYLAPLYYQIIDAVGENDIARARELQQISVNCIELCATMPFMAAMREIMRFAGFDCGPVRLPETNLTAEQKERLEQGLGTLDLMKWICPEPQPALSAEEA